MKTLHKRSGNTDDEMEIKIPLSVCMLLPCHVRVWLFPWVFVYELSGCGFESGCSMSVL